MGRSGCFIAGVLLTLMAVFLICQRSASPPTSSRTKARSVAPKTVEDWPSAELRAKAPQGIQDLTRIGLIKKVVVDDREVWVDPEVWRPLPYANKGDFAAVCAVYMGLQRSGDYRVTIRDHLTGKTLATYSKSWGFSLKD